MQLEPSQSGGAEWHSPSHLLSQTTRVQDPVTCSRARLWASRRLACLLAIGCGVLGCAREADSRPTTSLSPSTSDQPKVEWPKEPLRAQQKVQDVKALGHNGQRVTLGAFSERPLLVYFCPRVGDAACTQLATHLRDAWLELVGQVEMVLGVSLDEVVVQRAFASGEKLPQLLVSDGEHQVHRAFGRKPGDVVSYLVGTDKTILRVFEPPDTERHAQEVLKALQELGLRRTPLPP